MQRREFIRLATAAPIVSLAPPEARSRLVLTRNEKVQDSSRHIQTTILATMVDAAVCAFFNVDNPLDGWRTVATPKDIVGLKVNCLAGRGLSTAPELVDVVVEKLAQAGVPKSRIVIWDRMNDDLDRAGFSINTRHDRGPLCFGNDSAGFESDLTIQGSVGSLLSRTLAAHCTVQINLPILKDHGIVGMTASLKNWFGAIHNPNKYHENAGDPYIADLNMIPQIRQRCKLILCDMLTCQYEGGPPYLPQFAWPYNGLLIGRDPVALDRIGWDIIEAKRKAMQLPTLQQAGREPVYIRTAADAGHRLGQFDRKLIEVVEV